MSEITVIEKKAVATIERANSLVITNQQQYVAATDFLKGIKALEKEVEEAFDPIIEKAHQAHKEALLQKDKYYKPLINAERLIKGKIGTYNMEQERLQKEQEERLRREAEERERKLREQAAAASKKGDKEKAEALTEKANSVYAPPIAPTIEKVDGVTVKDNWYAEVVDVKILPREFMLPNMTALNQYAKATKGAQKIPGVVFRCEKVVSSTAR